MTSLYMPDVQVEIAFDSGFATPAADRTWTDVSDYVENAAGIGTGYGRGDEFNVADANSLTLTLDNSDGRFTPEKASGTYFPNVKIGRPIRVTATRVGGSSKDRFVGYIDSWNLSSAGANPTVTVAAMSQIARLGTTSALGGAQTILETFAGLEGIYALCETTTPCLDTNLVFPELTQNSFAASCLSAPQFGVGTGPDGEQTAVRLNDAALAYNYPPAPAIAGMTRYPTGLLAGDECVVEYFLVIAPSAGIQLIVRGNAMHPTLGLGSQTLTLNYDTSTGLASASVYNTVAGGGPNVSVAVAYTAGLHHLAARATATGLTLYFDGAPIGTTASTACGPLVDLDSIIIAGPGDDCDVSYLALSNDGSTIGQRALAGLSIASTQTASERIALAASVGGVESPNIDTTTDELDAYSSLEKSVLDVMRAAETSDGGVLFDAADGTLTYRTRTDRYNAASAFTLDVSLQQVEASVAPRLDRSALTNEVTVTRSGADDELGRFADADSIADYGVVRSSFEIQADADHCYQAAAWAVFLHGEPGVRIPNLEIDLLALSAALQDAVLAAEIGTRFTVTGLPVEFPTGTLDFFVEGYSEAIALETYRITLNVSPYDPAKFDVWTVEDAVYGAYDSNPLAY